MNIEEQQKQIGNTTNKGEEVQTTSKPAATTTTGVLTTAQATKPTAQQVTQVVQRPSQQTAPQKSQTMAEGLCEASGDCNEIDELCFEGACKKVSWIESQYISASCKNGVCDNCSLLSCENCKEGKMWNMSISYQNVDSGIKIQASFCAECKPNSKRLQCKLGYKCESFKCVPES